MVVVVAVAAKVSKSERARERESLSSPNCRMQHKHYRCATAKRYTGYQGDEFSPFW